MKSVSKIAILALGVLAAGPAAAQLATGSKAPVDVAADGQEFTNSTCVSVWRGNVEALQDTSRLRTDVLKAYFQKGSANPGSTGGSCGDLLRMEAEGSVYYSTPQQRVHGETAVYDATNEILTVTGGVVAAQGQNVMRGEKMVINTKTGEGHMAGAQTGRNAPNRVRGVFYPKDNSSNNSKNSAQPAPAAGQRR